MDVKTTDSGRPGLRNLMFEERRIADGGFRITQGERETRDKEGF